MKRQKICVFLYAPGTLQAGSVCHNVDWYSDNPKDHPDLVCHEGTPRQIYNFANEVLDQLRREGISNPEAFARKRAMLNLRNEVLGYLSPNYR